MESPGYFIVDCGCLHSMFRQLRVSQMEQVGESVRVISRVDDVLCGPELQGDPPLLGQGGQGGEQGALHQLQLPEVAEVAWAQDGATERGGGRQYP